MSTFVTRGTLGIVAGFTLASILVGSTPVTTQQNAQAVAQREADSSETTENDFLEMIRQQNTTSRSAMERRSLSGEPIKVDANAVWVTEAPDLKVVPKPLPPPPPPPPPVVEEPQPVVTEKESPAPKKPAPAPTKKAPPAKAVPAGDSQAIAHAMMADYGWGDDQFTCLVNLWTRESGWNHLAKNPSSGAYGIPQSLPGSKMASAGADWQTNPATQIKWGLGYIKGRYKTPCGGWDHFLRKNWY